MKTRSEARAEKAKVENDVERAAIVEEGAKKSEVERISGELRDVLKPPPKNPFQWPNANKAKMTELREDLRKVVETIFSDEIHAEWKILEEALQLGSKRTEHAHVIRALDKAAHYAYRATVLYMTAKLARDKWEAENDTIWGAMWSEATQSLQHEKDTGTRSKQITDGDVKARVATLHPDQYRAQEESRRAVELTVRILERLADIWFKRQGDLSAMTSKLRG